MNSLAVLAVLLALQQDKPPVTIAPETPTENQWPIAGRANRPNGTVVKISALRVERRWEATTERFHELVSSESRLSRSAEIDGKSFRGNLKAGATGLYDISVHEGDQRLCAERHLLGSPGALLVSTKRSVLKLVDVCDRANAALDEIQKVHAGKLPGTSQARDAFIKKIAADEAFLEEVAARTDLTASAFLLREICSQLRNAQVWELPAAKGESETNDAAGGGKDLFLDPKLNFKTLRAWIESARAVISREVALSATSMLAAICLRAEEKPDRLLSKAKAAASEALKMLDLAPAPDQEAKAAIEAAERAEGPGLTEARKTLQAFVSKYLAEP